MRRLLLALVAASSLAAHAYAEPAPAAQGFVDALASKVIDIVKDEGASRADKETKIETLFVDKVDIDFIAKFVLGKNWRTATPEQQKNYVAAYKPFILKNYAGRLAKYSGQTYTLKNSRMDGDASMVTMVIHDTDGKDVVVDYRLQPKGKSFKVVDIIVEGVSLLQTQRSEFNGIVERKGIDGLIQALQTQVASK